MGGGGGEWWCTRYTEPEQVFTRHEYGEWNLDEVAELSVQDHMVDFHPELPGSGTPVTWMSRRIQGQKKRKASG